MGIKLRDEIEKLEATGQESDKKAVKWVQKLDKEETARNKKKADEALDKLTSHKKQTFTYKEYLLENALKEMKGFDIPKGFRWNLIPTKKGLCLVFQNMYTKKWYARGMRISQEPEPDFSMIMKFMFDAVDQMEHQLEPKQTDSGIILP